MIKGNSKVRSNLYGSHYEKLPSLALCLPRSMIQTLCRGTGAIQMIIVSNQLCSFALIRWLGQDCLLKDICNSRFEGYSSFVAISDPSRCGCCPQSAKVFSFCLDWWLCASCLLALHLLVSRIALHQTVSSACGILLSTIRTPVYGQCLADCAN